MYLAILLVSILFLFLTQSANGCSSTDPQPCSGPGVKRSVPDFEYGQDYNGEACSALVDIGTGIIDSLDGCMGVKLKLYLGVIRSHVIIIFEPAKLKKASSACPTFIFHYFFVDCEDEFNVTQTKLFSGVEIVRKTGIAVPRRSNFPNISAQSFTQMVWDDSVKKTLKDLTFLSDEKYDPVINNCGLPLIKFLLKRGIPFGSAKDFVRDSLLQTPEGQAFAEVVRGNKNKDQLPVPIDGDSEDDDVVSSLIDYTTTVGRQNVRQDVPCNVSMAAMACVDGSACTVKSCDKKGNCVVTGINCPPLQCRAPGTCNIVSAQCVYETNTTGDACDDGDPCTIGDTCFNGVCIGSPKCLARTCQDFPTCNSTTGVCGFLLNVTNGTNATQPCNDGNPCTRNDRCRLGVCIGDPINGTVGSPACDDGNNCTQLDRCVNGQCQGVGCDFTIDKQCATAVCAVGSGCMVFNNNGAACNDRNNCTINDTCSNGRCVGTNICCFERSMGRCGICAQSCNAVGDQVRSVFGLSAATPVSPSNKGSAVGCPNWCCYPSVPKNVTVINGTTCIV